MKRPYMKRPYVKRLANVTRPQIKRPSRRNTPLGLRRASPRDYGRPDAGLVLPRLTRWILRPGVREHPLRADRVVRA